MYALKRHVTDRELVEHIDDELPESRRSEVDGHLSECDVCRARQALMTSVASATLAECRSTVTTDPALSGQSRARLEIALAHMTEEPRRSWPALAAVAAAVVVLAAWASIRVGTEPARSVDVRHGLALPVAAITPGATWDIGVEELCSGTTPARPITVAMRAEVLSAYGVEHVPADQYELDYLITPELGGATDARNLWPQGYASPVWNARVKDELERLLPQLVCSRQLDLGTAQRDMAVDWIAAYKKYFRTDLPLEAHRGPALDDDESGVYLLADAGPAPAIRLVSLRVMR